jgi:hypothetical protein
VFNDTLYGNDRSIWIARLVVLSTENRSTSISLHQNMKGIYTHQSFFFWIILLVGCQTIIMLRSTLLSFHSTGSLNLSSSSKTIISNRYDLAPPVATRVFLLRRRNYPRPGVPLAPDPIASFPVGSDSRVGVPSFFALRLGTHARVCLGRSFLDCDGWL